MFKKKYSKILTVILAIVIIGIIASLGYIVYDSVYVQTEKREAEDVAEEFIKKTTKKIKKTEKNETDNETTEEIDISEIQNYIDSQQKNIETELANKEAEKESENENESEKVYMSGYEVKGTIEIPATGIKYPILERVTKKSLETSVAILYPENATLNSPGNITIVGHNYRNGAFFSDNKKLKVNDVIYITDQDGNRVAYSIYKTYYTTPDDAEYMKRDTEGAREISLSTCNDDASTRLIILAREK